MLKKVMRIIKFAAGRRSSGRNDGNMYRENSYFDKKS
jgi:hypothetical protein